ncbi:hypothetical protein [Mucilaginibacter celer]|uniref:Tetratricopeptide repeat protein n=1 Tax=Mucilaginibacter celer TaxID=2305508 RepID=A0A494VJ98_9SPHI|nr:hypothetical protein [Mucilaginibacter celer]AYL93849.1 hypothetical protein HYN43_000410 [Mucilaginibacter celer]
MKTVVKLGLLVALMFEGITGYAQTNCPQYTGALKRAQQNINAKKFPDALNDILFAQAALGECKVQNPGANLSMSEADNLLKELIRKQAEDARETNDKQLRELEGYIARLIKLVQQSGATGFSTLKPKLLEQLKAAQNYIDANHNTTNELGNIDLYRTVAESYEQNGDETQAFANWESGFQSAIKIVDGLKKNTPERAWVSAIIICSEYADNLLNRGEINQVNNIITTCQEHYPSLAGLTPQGFEALARLEFVNGRYREATHGYAQAILHYGTTIRLAKKAGGSDFKNERVNLLLTRCYNAILLGRRLNHFRVDTLAGANPIVPTGLFEKLKIAFAQSQSSNANLAIINLRYNLASVLIAQGKLSDAQAQDSLTRILSQIGTYKSTGSTQATTQIVKADIHAQMATIYRRRNDKDEAIAETGVALKYWMASIDTGKKNKENIMLIADAGLLIEKNLARSFPEENALQQLKQMSELVTMRYGDDANRFPDIAFMLGKLQARQADLIEGKKTTQDSIKAYSLFVSATNHFHQSGELADPANYRPDFAIYTHTACRILLYELAHRQYTAAENTARFIMREIMPLYRINDFDINMGLELTLANNVYGHYLFSNAMYAQAIEPLTFASLHGMQSATNHLIAIYSGLYINQQEKARFYRIRVGTQKSDAVKTYLLPLTTTTPDADSVKVYITDRAVEFPYRGIEDAVKWVKIVYHQNIDKRYVDAFNRYQEQAQNNHSPFQELSDQALDDAKSAIFILNKYASHKTAIANAYDVNKRLLLSEKLYKQYKNDLSVDSVNAGVIKKDAIPFYINYARQLKAAARVVDYRNVYKQVLLLDPGNKEALFAMMEMEFQENRNKFIKDSYKADFEHLKNNLSFFLIEGVNEAANNTRNKILGIREDAETRDYIVSAYSAFGKQDIFAELFLDKKLNHKEFIDYFTKKSVDSISNDAKREYYNHMIQLDQKYLQIIPSDSAVRKLASIHCSNFVWTCLLTKKDVNLISYLQQSSNYDPKNQFATGNLLSVYLFNNDYEDAKPEYDKFRNNIFSETGPFRTYNDYYTFCVTELRKAGLKNKSISIFSDLLINHTENNIQGN